MAQFKVNHVSDHRAGDFFGFACRRNIEHTGGIRIERFGNRNFYKNRLVFGGLHIFGSLDAVDDFIGFLVVDVIEQIEGKIERGKFFAGKLHGLFFFVFVRIGQADFFKRANALGEGFLFHGRGVEHRLKLIGCHVCGHACGQLGGQLKIVGADNGNGRFAFVKALGGRRRNIIDAGQRHLIIFGKTFHIGLHIDVVCNVLFIRQAEKVGIIVIFRNRSFAFKECHKHGIKNLYHFIRSHTVSLQNDKIVIIIVAVEEIHHVLIHIYICKNLFLGCARVGLRRCESIPVKEHVAFHKGSSVGCKLKIAVRRTGVCFCFQAELCIKAYLLLSVCRISLENTLISDDNEL